MNNILRNFWITITRFRMASALNVVGLSVAYAAFMVVMMQITYQFGFDKQYPDGDRICRLNAVVDKDEYTIIPRGAFDRLDKVSSIEEATLTESSWGRTTHIVADKAGTPVGFNEEIFKAWPNFPQFFGLGLIDGSFEKFVEPGSLIIPRSIAQKIFDTPYVAGRAIRLGGSSGDMFTIAAVFEDLPKNSQFQNVIYLSFPIDQHKGQWNASNYNCYVRIASGSTAADVQSDMKILEPDKHSEWIDSFSLLPIEDIYFDSKLRMFDQYGVKKGDLGMTYLFFAIGLLVIGIAVVNFVNFSTSLAPLRMKSINIQKVLGNPTSTLRTMLIGEAALISFISFLFSVWWIYGLSVSGWQNITAAGISFTGNWPIIMATGLLSIIIGIAAGIYPAFYTTRFAPALVLKGSFAMGRNGRILRTSLVGIQFVISIALIISSLFLQQQNIYMQKMDKGYHSDGVVVVSINQTIRDQAETFENELKTTSSIQDIAYSNSRIGRDNLAQGWSREFRAGEDANFNAFAVSWNFPQLMGIDFLSGEPIGQEDTNNKAVDIFFIINERLAKQINVPAGHRFDIDDSTYSVVQAVVDNFNFKSLRLAVEPTALVVSNLWMVGNMNFAYIKTNGDLATAMTDIRRVIAKIDPSYPATIESYDDGFQFMYRDDIQTTNLISFFSLLAIIISLVGVFGLVVFETQYRRKEIGVRKIMGSTIGQILVMFNRKFAVIVGVCFVVAAAASYFVVDWWLNGFVYRIPMHWWIFAAGGAIVFVVTLGIVTTLVYRAATQNPVKSLSSN